MDRTEAKNVLSNLGLSDWEIEAYIILVRYGPQTAVELSRLSKVARSKTYEVITRLRRKGLVVKVPPMPTKGITQKFVANDPKILFSDRISDIRKLSGYLTEAYNNPLKPRYPNVHFYTTKETAKKFLLRIVSESKDIHVNLVNFELKNVLGYSFDQAIEDLNKKKSEFLLSDNKEFRQFGEKLNKKSLISNNEGINYIITRESVILDLWREQHIILEIRSKEIVKTFLNQFSVMSKS